MGRGSGRVLPNEVLEGLGLGCVKQHSGPLALSKGVPSLCPPPAFPEEFLGALACREPRFGCPTWECPLDPGQPQEGEGQVGGGLGYLRTQEQGQPRCPLPLPHGPLGGGVDLLPSTPAAVEALVRGSRSGLGGALCPHDVRRLRGGSGQQRFCEDGNWEGQSDGGDLGRGFRVSRPPHPGLAGYSWWALLLTPTPARIPSAGFGLWDRKRPSGTWLSPLGPVDQDSGLILPAPCVGSAAAGGLGHVACPPPAMECGREEAQEGGGRGGGGLRVGGAEGTLPAL